MPEADKANTSKLLAQPVADNPQQRLKWIAHLEFAQSVKSEGIVSCFIYVYYIYNIL